MPRLHPLAAHRAPSARISFTPTCHPSTHVQIFAPVQIAETHNFPAAHQLRPYTPLKMLQNRHNRGSAPPIRPTALTSIHRANGATPPRKTNPPTAQRTQPKTPPAPSRMQFFLKPRTLFLTKQTHRQ